MSELISNQFSGPTPVATEPKPEPTGAENLARLKALLDEIAALFPDRLGNIGLTIGDGEYRSVTFYSVPNYGAARDVLRSIGVRKWHKQIVDPAGVKPWTCLNAHTAGPTVKVYCDELPPTCRLERAVERVPKMLVTHSNDEFIEIERTKVVCGSGGSPDGEEAA